MNWPTCFHLPFKLQLNYLSNGYVCVCVSSFILFPSVLVAGRIRIFVAAKETQFLTQIWSRKCVYSCNFILVHNYVCYLKRWKQYFDNILISSNKWNELIRNLSLGQFLLSNEKNSRNFIQLLVTLIFDQDANQLLPFDDVHIIPDVSGFDFMEIFDIAVIILMMNFSRLLILFVCVCANILGTASTHF